jgi:hypothetical protein
MLYTLEYGYVLEKDELLLASRSPFSQETQWKARSHEKTDYEPWLTRQRDG